MGHDSGCCGVRILLAHPEAKYFNVGKIGDDQVADMAARRGGGKMLSGGWRRICDVTFMIIVHNEKEISLQTGKFQFR